MGREGGNMELVATVEAARSLQNHVAQFSSMLHVCDEHEEGRGSGALT